MKYIDAEKLKVHIQYLIKKDNYELFDVPELLSFIDSLQQEQPEVDLDKEVDNYFQGLWPGMETPEQCNTDMHFTPPAIMRMARHFYELGKNSK